MSEKANRLSINTILSLSLNIISSVGIIFINKKLVFVAAGFNFGTALTIIHFIVTFLGCLLFSKLGFFEIKKLPPSKVLSISAAFCGYVAFNNLSLLFNSVPFYQITKILCTPVIVAVEMSVYHKSFTKEALTALVPVCLGIFVTVYADTEINFIGTFWACLAVVANSFYTIWGKTKQTELEVSALQILTYQAPISAIMLTMALPWMDPWHDLIAYEWTTIRVFYVLLSCIFAFGVNFSFFLFVGQTSPLTMNVVGYVKTCLVFVGGFLFFSGQLTLQMAVGITLTMIGVGMYTKATMPSSGGSSSGSKPSVPTLVVHGAQPTSSAHGVAHRAPSASDKKELKRTQSETDL